MISLSESTIFAGRYRVVRLIGQGGMGAVFEVVHVETERRCALKVMQPNVVEDEVMRARFRQEAKVAALVNSEHIVDVYDAGFDEATRMPFLVMELLNGVELRQQLKTQGPLRPEDVALYLYQTALALDKTHRKNIIHRDLKPENLFLTFRENGAPHIKILDFGIAKFMAESNTNTNATRDVGTPLYMGPEQFTMGARPSPQTDIYALGMIAYTLLTGVSYWADDNKAASTIYAFAMHVVKGPPEPASVRALRRGVRLPPAFDTWFARATARDPQQRFPSAIVAATELGDAFGVPLVGTELSLTNAGMRPAMSSSWGSGLPSARWTGTGGGAITAEPGNATGAPLATTSGTRKEGKGKVVLAAILSGGIVLIIGLIVIFTREGSTPSPVAAASTDVAPIAPSAAVTTNSTTPTIAPIPEPTTSASAVAASPPPKTTSRSTGPAKPVNTGASTKKKDLFTRD